MESEKVKELSETMRKLADYIDRNHEYIEDFKVEFKHDPIYEGNVGGFDKYSEGSKSWEIKIWEKDKYECQRIQRSKQDQSK